MQIRFIISVLAISLAAGCGGGKSKKGAAASSGGSGAGGPPSVLAGQSADGTPVWVNRGSGMVKGEAGRVFYGVGIASGIRNASLLRTTADNRARSELGKVFEVFTASLMKDYMNSDGEQQVEQAIKTASSKSLKGVTITDRYIAADGSLYALAQLDMKTFQGVLDAEAKGAVKSHTKKVSAEDIFDERAKKAPPPKPAVAKAQGGADKKAPDSASSGAKERSGAKPAWVDGYDPSYPYEEWLCAVGLAPARPAAENAAFAALSRIFEAHVSSVSKDFMGAYSKTGAQTLEVQNSETLTEVSTNKVFSGVRIPEVWSGEGSIYALACLNRSQAASVLRQDIQAADERAGKHLDSARRQDKAQRVRELKKALESLAERESLNGELRIVNASGVGMPGSYSHVDVVDAFEAAVDALKIGVVAEGPYDGDFRSALIEGLTKRGYKVTEGASDGMDVVVNAVIRMEDGGKGTGRRKSMHFARGVIQVEVKNGAQGKILGSMSESRKEGHRSKDEAERRAVRKLAKKLIQKVGAKIEATMMR